MLRQREGEALIPRGVYTAVGVDVRGVAIVGVDPSNSERPQLAEVGDFLQIFSGSDGEVEGAIFHGCL